MGWSPTDWQALTPQQKAAALADNLRSGGLNETAIAGILQNVKDESNFNPTLRHYDQPRFSMGDERAYAHGLYQDGAEEWSGYNGWLKKNHPDANWQDPNLQTSYLVDRLKGNTQVAGGNDYSRLGTFDKLNSAKTPGEAATVFVHDYLRPSAPNMARRSHQYLSGGVKDLGAWTGGAQPPSQQGSINGGFGLSPTGDAGIAGPVDTAEAGHDAPTSQFKDLQPPTQQTTAVVSAAPASGSGPVGAFSPLKTIGQGVTAAASAFSGGQDDREAQKLAQEQDAAAQRANANAINEDQSRGAQALQTLLSRIKSRQPQAAFG